MGSNFRLHNICSLIELLLRRSIQGSVILIGKNYLKRNSISCRLLDLTCLPLCIAGTHQTLSIFPITILLSDCAKLPNEIITDRMNRILFFILYH